MVQFHAHRLPDDTLVLDLQSNLTSTKSRVVAPMALANERGKPLTRLEPEIGIDGTIYILQTADMAAIPERLLGEPVADLMEYDYQIRAALDMVFSGF